MEIIKKGKLPEEQIFEGDCYYCNSLIRAKQKEIEVTHCQRDGTYGSGQCPVCKTNMTFYPVINYEIFG